MPIPDVGDFFSQPLNMVDYAVVALDWILLILVLLLQARRIFATILAIYPSRSRVFFSFRWPIGGC